MQFSIASAPDDYKAPPEPNIGEQVLEALDQIKGEEWLRIDGTNGRNIRSLVERQMGRRYLEIIQHGGRGKKPVVLWVRKRNG